MEPSRRSYRPATPGIAAGEVAVSRLEVACGAVPAGPHVIGAAILDQQRGAGVDDQFSDFRINSVFTPGGGVQTVVITGPFKASAL